MRADQLRIFPRLHMSPRSDRELQPCLERLSLKIVTFDNVSFAKVILPQ